MMEIAAQLEAKGMALVVSMPCAELLMRSLMMIIRIIYSAVMMLRVSIDRDHNRVGALYRHKGCVSIDSFGAAPIDDLCAFQLTAN
jgi:hypothetical protein